jgi:hypothetical protein
MVWRCVSLSTKVNPLPDGRMPPGGMWVYGSLGVVDVNAKV